MKSRLALEWLENLVLGLGYSGAFLAGLLGTSSLFIAIFPSFIVVPILGTVLDPLPVGILAGLGAGIGQYLHYYIGLGGRFLVSEKRKASLEKWRIRLDRYGVLLIFLFAATPLTPDDVIWIPLGLIKYPRLKALFAAIAGKTVLNLFYAYAGRFGWKLLEELIKF